jgi:hypothetical protein
MLRIDCDLNFCLLSCSLRSINCELLCVLAPLNGGEFFLIVSSSRVDQNVKALVRERRSVFQWELTRGK